MTIINGNYIVPFKAIHPTYLIKEELKARGMKRKWLAECLGMKTADLNTFLSGKESITPSMALKLEDAFGISADMWMRLQQGYERDVEEIRKRDGRLP